MGRERITVTVDMERMHSAGLSFYVRDADGRQHLLPISQCTVLDGDGEEADDSVGMLLELERGESVDISMPEWLATREGLI